MQIYGLELLTVYHHPGKSCEHRHCDCGYIVFLICHLNSREHMFKGLCELTGGSPLWNFTTFPCLVAIGLVEVEM